MIDGRTVMEADSKGKSSREIQDLWTYVSDRLEKNFRPPVFNAQGIAGSVVAPRAAAGGFGCRAVGQCCGGARIWANRNPLSTLRPACPAARDRPGRDSYLH